MNTVDNTMPSLPLTLKARTYSSVTLKLWIMKHQALMSEYDYLNYNKLNAFSDHLPEEHHEEFKAIIEESQLLARTSSQASLDAADIAAWSVSTVIVLWWASWLQLSGFPGRCRILLRTFFLMVTNCLQSLWRLPSHLKGFTGYFRSLGIHTPANKRKFRRPQMVQRSPPVYFSTFSRPTEPPVKRLQYLKKKAATTTTTSF